MDSSEFPPQVQHPARQLVAPPPGVLFGPHMPRLLSIALIVAALIGCVLGAITFFAPLTLISGLVLVAALLAFFATRGHSVIR